ncbi:MAG: DUF6208 family protein [Pseudanabaenales cyanobacterium]|nr:DUF6208 family protein [Pseudanabaenales cyanobacterium]
MNSQANQSALELDALWEVPLGTLSFLFSRALRWVLHSLRRYYKLMNKPHWQVFSADFFAKPIKLLWIMSRARWNLHSLIGLAGPFNVAECLTIHVATISQSAPNWTAVFYTLKDSKTHAHISSLTISGEHESETVSLPAGRYFVGLRHYHWTDPVTLPTIWADGVEALAAQTISAPPDANRFYCDLIHRQGLIHICLNGYVYPLLRYRRWLPAKFVQNTFLPAPNPETQFHYGALRPGEQLQVQLAASLLHTHDIFFSLYNRFCFPLDWYPIKEEKYITSPCDRKAIFVIRVHPKQRDAIFPLEAVRLTTVAIARAHLHK